MRCSPKCTFLVYLLKWINTAFGSIIAFNNLVFPLIPMNSVQIVCIYMRRKEVHLSTGPTAKIISLLVKAWSERTVSLIEHNR